MVPQGGGSRTHTHTHTCTHVQYTYRQLVWSLFVPRSSRVRCIYIYTHTRTIYVPIRIYKTINFSLSLLPSILSIHLSPSLLQTSLSASRFRGWPSWPAFTARARSEYHRLWNSLSKLGRATPSLAPGETTRKSTADCNQPSPRTSIPRRLSRGLWEEGRSCRRLPV